MGKKKSTLEEKVEISIVVPTFRESKNIDSLTRRIFSTLSKFPRFDAELVLVEDNSGTDTLETTKVVLKLQQEGFPIRMRLREKSEGQGLSSAVLVGLKETNRPYIVVMDADLQHEPESIPSLLEPVLTEQADFSIGSRNATGAETSESWPLIRRVISWGATTLAKPLTTCSDPMSGFFALPRSTFNRALYLNPTGYKIGLELMVRCKCQKIAEVPIQFRDRLQGESKLTMKQNILYVQHLARLYWFRFPVQVVLFVVVLHMLALLLLYVMFRVLF